MILHDAADKVVAGWMIAVITSTDVIKLDFNRVLGFDGARRPARWRRPGPDVAARRHLQEDVRPQPPLGMYTNLAKRCSV